MPHATCNHWRLLEFFLPSFRFHVYFTLLFNYYEHEELNSSLVRGEFEAMDICLICIELITFSYCFVKHECDLLICLIDNLFLCVD